MGTSVANKFVLSLPARLATLRWHDECGIGAILPVQKSKVTVKLCHKTRYRCPFFRHLQYFETDRSVGVPQEIATRA